MYMEKRQWKFRLGWFSLKFDQASVLQTVNFRDLRWNLTGPSMSGTAMWSTTARRLWEGLLSHKQWTRILHNSWCILLGNYGLKPWHPSENQIAIK
jgi:hypothetical protein